MSVGFYETHLLNKLKEAFEKEEFTFRKKSGSLYVYTDLLECIFFLDEDKKVEELWINECEYFPSDDETIQRMLDWIMTKSKQRVRLLF
jgi:hypothetical protein